MCDISMLDDKQDWWLTAQLPQSGKLCLWSNHVFRLLSLFLIS